MQLTPNGLFRKRRGYNSKSKAGGADREFGKKSKLKRTTVNLEVSKRDRE